jgi:hypothetical protein
LEIPLEIRDLIHWNDGSAQYRGNIPTTNNSQINLYVLNPSFYYVVFQDILFVDLTNQFPPTQTTVTWQGFVSGNLVNIHQSYLDSDYNTYAYLENQGQYKLIISSPYATREIGWITISSTTASRTISIINQPFIPITIWQTTQLNITSDNSTGTIRVDYYDISNQTTNLKTYIYLQHNQTPIYTSDLNTSHAAVTYIGNTSLNYLVRVYATHGNTTDQVVQAITFNNGVFNLYLPDTLFDQPKVYWTTIACLVALTFTAFIFGAYFAGLCNIVIFTELASFVYFGWMMINIETLAFIGLIGFLSVLTSRRHTQ